MLQPQETDSFSVPSNLAAVSVSWGGMVDYLPTWQAMRRFTLERGPMTPDAIWCVEHPPVFTLGQAGRLEHVLGAGEIPLVHADRGGQVTYHGPGQLLVYVLFDLQRLGLGIRKLVTLLEQSVIDLLLTQGVHVERKPGAPGVYAAGKKLAALGLRVRRGCCYHGLAINVAMDLEPFRRIHPCGYAGLEVTQLADLGLNWDTEQTSRRLLRQLIGHLPHAHVERLGTRVVCE